VAGVTGTLGRARAALASRDFRFLLAARLTSQFGDGFFQAYLIARLVFLDPEGQSTAAGVARAFAIIVLPFSLIGPFAGVFIDRWSRRRILGAAPLVRASAVAALVALDGSDAWVFALALVAMSANRFYLATAGAVMPTLVPAENLLVGNAMATVGGTVLTFVGVVAGTKVADALGSKDLLVIILLCWPSAAFLARRIRGSLRAARPATSIRGDLARVAADLGSGVRRLAATPAALGSIVSVSLDQFLVGFVTVVSLVVFKEQFREGVGSYGNILAAGGVGVLAGTLTVGWLEQRLPKVRIVTAAFALAGVSCVGVAPVISGQTILLASFALGLTFAWRKVPVDTIVQSSIPDRYRGRVMAVYDLLYSTSRVFSALLAVVLIPRLSSGWLLGLTGLAYLLWTPVVPAWIRRPRWVQVHFYAGGRSDEVPRSVRVGGEDEPVEVIGAWNEERDGSRLRRFRLRTSDGTILEIALGDRGERWRLEREEPQTNSLNRQTGQ
jgi:MFS family permease